MTIRLWSSFVKECISCRYGTLRAPISNGGSHFCRWSFETVLRKYFMTHKITTPYLPQASSQVRVSNYEIKSIFEKTVQPHKKD